jgi:hypothetical protein
MIQIREKKFILTFVIVMSLLVPSAMLTIGTNVIKLDADDIITFSYNNEPQLYITFNMQDFTEEKITNEYGQYSTINIPQGGYIGNIGKPQLPIVTRLIAVPNLDITLNIIDTQIAESRLVGKIYPSQNPQTDSDAKETKFIIDEAFYKQNNNYPGKLVEISYEGKIRDISFIKIEFYPIQYNPKQGIVTIYDEITVEITSDISEPIKVESDFEHSYYYTFYENVFSNWQGFIENTQVTEPIKEAGNGFREEGCDYLIITHPDFQSEITELANWKHAKGFMTKVVDTTITGFTSNEIKQYIQDAYDTWNPRPSYLLLVGDNEFVPPSSSGTGTDLYYVTTDGSDYFPDMFHGRIPADTPQEAEIIVQKILTYEQNPPTLSSFYENFAVAAYFQDDEQDGYETRRFVRTSEEIRDYLMTLNYEGERIYVTEPYINPTHYNNGYYGDGEPLPEELLRPDFPWDGEAEDIINSIENGIFILNHRDHGFEDGWGDPYFDTGHVDGLTNGELLPVVFSINCLTGQYDDYECFAEEFLRKEGGGAVAVFAATRVSYSGYNDYLCRGFYDAQWPDFDTDIGTDIPMYTLGELLNYGKIYMTQTWGDSWGYEDYTFELFHVFGDPTMEIWSAEPQDLSVTYTFTGDLLEVAVKSGADPADGALVCLCQESGFFAKSKTCPSGRVLLSTASADLLEEASLIVSYHNHNTYQEMFYLNQPPSVPDKPAGPAKGGPNKEFTFSTSTIDPDGDQVYYMWRWGDGQYSDWFGPYNSGETVEASHSWNDTSNYQIRVKAKDIVTGLETDWSEPLWIQIQKTKTVNSFLYNLLNRFPNAFLVLKLLL